MTTQIRPFAASCLALLLTLPTHAGSIVPLGCPDLECSPTPDPNSGFVGVATGNYHSMGLRSDGSIVAWGMCDVGQCSVPLPNSGFKSISSGDSHSLALRHGGQIAVWGSEEYGLLQVPEPNSYVAIAAGGLHNLALRPGGVIAAWGYTPWGDVMPHVTNSGWVAIAAGGYYSMGLKADGSVHKWGCNGPCPVPSPNTGFVAIATHFNHSLSVRGADGSIVAWGSNASGQLDVPDPNRGFVSVAAGDRFSIGLKSDGTVSAWGTFNQDAVALPNRGYLAMTANSGLADLLKSDVADPVFSEAPQLPSRGTAKAYTLAADVDADGDQDLVSADYGADTVAWYDNDGGSPPLWTKRAVDPFAMGPQQVAVGDLDGDGDLDVLSSNFNEEGVFWYENSGGSPPLWTKRFVSPIAAWGVHAADLDGDGDVDGIGGNRWDNTPEHKGIEWYENSGASPPTFTVRRISTGFVDAASVHAADVNGDGDMDVLAVDVFPNSVYWYENSGTNPPTWTQRIVTATADDPFSVFPADIDEDGDVDILAASMEDDTVAWYENSGTQTPTWIRRVITSQAPQALAVFAGDLDGDGDLDVASGAGGDEIAWYESNGATPPSFTRRVLSNRCRGPASVFGARLDPDADVDLVAGCDVAGEIHWFPSWAAQAESDQDGVPDALDCAPNDSTAYAVPGAVRAVRYDFRNALSWTPPSPTAGSGTRYEVLRGSLHNLPVGSGSGEVCLASGMFGTVILEASVPAPRSGFYFLVRGVNACGNGSYGAASSGAERTSEACP